MYGKIAATLIIAFATLSSARAENAEKLALSVPAEVTEVATAGTWSDGDASGVFRATVLTVPAGETTQAHLVLQLMTVSPDGSTSKIYKTVAVKKIADKKLPNAFLAVEEDGTENEVTWRVTSYDANSNADIGALVTINAKGEVTVKDAPKEEDTAAQGEVKKN
ncbi:MAG: hypothetical protein HY765_07300 [Rhodomicrobium sp.]|nr:hypothetical protein [Rhodomicrobium sp.]